MSAETPEISIERANTVRYSQPQHQRRQSRMHQQSSLEVPDGHRDSENDEENDGKRQQPSGRVSPSHSPLLNRRKIKRHNSVYRREKIAAAVRRSSVDEVGDGIWSQKQSGSTRAGDATGLLTGDSDDEDVYDEWSKPWYKKTAARYFYMCSYLMATVSVACNSPRTFADVSWMIYATVVVDCLLAIPFGLLIVADLNYRGFRKNKRRSAPFVKNVWCWIDSLVYVCLLMSIAMQGHEIYCYETYRNETYRNETYRNETHRCPGQTERVYFANDARSLVRFPRALTVLLIFRFAKFKSPSKRTKRILSRAGKQIRNAAILFLFFTFLFAFIGVQVFQGASDHCVDVRKVDASSPKCANQNVTKSICYSTIEKAGYPALAIPDTRCHMENGIAIVGTFHLFPNDVATCNSSIARGRGENNADVRCPHGFECMHIDTNRLEESIGDFGDLYQAFLTVYECSTQEVWSFVMYDVADFIGGPPSIVFFTLLIFLVGWLAENVFVVVAIEAFADFRSKFLNRIAPVAPSSAPTRVLRRLDNGRGWRLESVVQVSKHSALKRIVESKPYFYFTLFVILVDAVLRSTRVVNGSNGLQDKVLFPIQVIVTVYFDIAVVVKILAHGMKPYFQNKTSVVSFIIALGSTVNVILWSAVEGDGKPHYMAIFPILRVLYLVKVSPPFTKFLERILGDGRRLGMLLFATILFLFIFGVVAMQVFCHFRNVEKFSTFPKAFMSSFQLIIQEEWVELTSEVMNQIKSESYVAYSASLLFFLPVHLIGSLIIFSTFVALINDNLELPEEEKLRKQEELSTKSIAGNKDLPFRLRIYNRFRNNPKWVRIPYAPDNYETPLIRESVMRQFIESGEQLRGEWRNQGPEALQQSRAEVPLPRRETHMQLLTSVAAGRPSLFRKRSSIASIISESNKSRNLQRQGMTLGRSSQMLSQQHKSLTQSALKDSPGQRRKNFQRQKERTHLDILGNDPSQVGRHGDGDQGGSDGVLLKIRRQREEAMRRQKAKMEELKENHQYFDKSLFLFSEDHWLRKFCLKITTMKFHSGSDEREKKTFKLSIIDNLKDFMALLTYMDWIAFLLAVISTAFLIQETNIFRSVTCGCTVFWIIDIIFVVMMGVELALKIIANGFFFCPKGFFKDVSSVVDLFIFMVSALYLIIAPTAGSETNGAKVLLVMRSLRPLRVVTLVPNLKKAIRETFVVKAGSGDKSRFHLDILYVSIAVVIFIFVFASYGLQLFAGQLERCNDDDVRFSSIQNCTGTFAIPISHDSRILFENDTPLSKMTVPRVWTNPRDCNFDHIYTAFLCLFEVITLEGWVKVRDVLSRQIGPVGTQVFLFTYIFLGILVVLTLFVGVILENFQKNNGTALLTVDQRRWRDLKKRVEILQPLTIPPRPENSVFRSWIYDKLQTRVYKWTSIFLVVLQSSLLAVPWTTVGVETRESSVDKTRLALLSVSVILQFIFVLEVIFKMVGLGLKGYFMSKRNIYEFAITLLGLSFIIGAVIILIIRSEDRQFKQIRHLGIAAVIFRYTILIGKINALKMLMQTLALTIIRSLYIIVSLIVFIICYALAGVVLFSRIKWGQGINRHANFESGSNGLLVMFRVMTGEDWNKIMHDCTISPPFCNSSGSSDCGSVWVSLIFFCTFYVLVSFIFLNVFIAVLMENFSLFYSSEEDALLTHAELKKFLEAWNLVDKEREGSIPVERVRFLFRLLEGRLEMNMEKLEDRIIFNYLCKEVEKSSKESGENKISFHVVLSILAYQALDNFEDFLLIEEVWQRKELDDTIRFEVAQQTIRDWLGYSVGAMNEGTESTRPSPVPPPLQPSMQHYGSREYEIMEASTDSDSDTEGVSGALRAHSQESLRLVVTPKANRSQSLDPEGAATADVSEIQRSYSPAPSDVSMRRRRISVTSDELVHPLGTKKATEEICKWFDEQMESQSDDCSD